MAAIDHRKTLKHLYAPSAKAAALVEVPPLRFLMIDGRGDPNTAPDYPVAVSALFTLAYTLTFALKRELGLDYAVMPLEGLWWAEDMGQFRLGQRDVWQWTMLIAQPEEVTAERLAAVGEAARKKVDAIRPRAGPAGGVPRGAMRPGAASRPLRRRGADD